MSVRTAIVLTVSSFLLGAQFTHWSVDHRTLWTQPITPAAITNALAYYSHLDSPPARPLRHLLSLAHLVVLLGLLAKLCQPTLSSVFDLASVVLLMAAAIIHTFQLGPLLAALAHTSGAAAARNAQALAALHTTIAVALTGLIALQLAQTLVNRSLAKQTRRNPSHSVHPKSY